MKKFMTALAIAGALVLGSFSGAAASGLIQHHQIADGAVHHDTIQDGAVRHSDLNWTIQDRLTQLARSGLRGAVYRVENYQNGGGGSATVACADTDAKSIKYTAIAGGVQGSESGTTETQSGFLISSSFPGRMDWDAGTPKPNRLDGWIVFGNSQYTSTLRVWALCVPNNEIQVKQVDLDNKTGRLHKP